MRPVFLIRFVLTLLYILVVLPAGLLMRMLGIDPMRQRPDAGSGSNWEQPKS